MSPSYDPFEIHLPTPPQHVHFVGIGGVGVSGLARILLGQGYRVSGSDMAASDATRALVELGATVAIGHDAANLRGAALVVATAAARDDNPELEAARALGVPIIKRAALLGRLSLDRQCLAVAGTHGKSTTSGMATLALERAGLSPSFAVGATVRELGTNAALGTGPQFVVEADEYDYSFLWLRPSVAIVTNIEYDHPDLFADDEAVLSAFERFVGCIRRDGCLVLCAEDAGCRALASRVQAVDAVRLVTFGETIGDWRIAARDGRTAHVSGPAGERVELALNVPGRHNLLNALAVLASARGLGIEPAELAPGLNAFGGVGRRFEVLFDSPDQVVIDDYAHHPTEIAATISAARERYPGRRLVVIFQPHTYSRTKALVDQFADALNRADVAILAEIYGARETETLGVSSGTIAAQMTSPAQVVATAASAASAAARAAQPGDVVLVMGAGDITRAAARLAEDARR